MNKSVINTTAINISVGLFVVFGFLALAFLSLKAANLNALSFNKSYMVSASFDNIGTLKLRAPVKSAGVVVGRVSSISFNDNSYQAIVNLDLDDQYHFSMDSSAKILTSGVLGEQYIAIEAGGDNKNLINGSVISNTQSAIVLEDLIGQFLFKSVAETGGSKK